MVQAYEFALEKIGHDYSSYPVSPILSCFAFDMLDIDFVKKNIQSNHL